MKISPDALRTIKRLSAALESRDDDRLLAELEELGADRLFDPEALEAARARAQPGLVILLATLWTANGRGGELVENLLLAYQSFTEKSPRPGLGRIWRAAVRAILDETAALDATEGDASAWAEAILFALDVKRADVAQRLVAAFVETGPSQPAAIALFRRLTTRHDAMSEHLDWRAIARIYAALEEIARGDGDSFALHLASAWQKAGDFEASLRAAARVAHGPLFRPARLVAARSWALDGCLPEAVEEMDSYLAACCEAPWIASTPAFDSAAAARGLADLQSCLAPLGVAPFLISGTLLGYARHGRLLAHDKDLDLGLFGWERQFEIVDALQRSGGFALDYRFLRGASAWMLPLTHRATGTAVDLFFYRRERDHCVTGIDTQWGYTQLFAFRAFDLGDVEFLGLRLKAPHDVDAYLTDAYGAWRTPQPAYAASVESPAIVDPGGAEHMLAARLALAKAVEEGRAEQGVRVLTALARHAQSALAMHPHLHQRMLDLCRGELARACA